MRALVLFALTACSNDVDPRVIPGGGIGDGEIDGEVNVFVIDGASDQPVTGATVDVGGTQKTTDATGLVVFSDVEGPQTIAIKATGYRSAVWVGANGANVTIPLRGSAVPDQAVLSGTIAGWETLTVPAGHLKAAVVLYSNSTKAGDAANDLKTPNNMNICAGQTCNWSVVSRTGVVTLIAAIVDRDPKGNLDPNDDTQTIIGWAYASGLNVQNGVAQTGLVLDQIEAGNLDTITIDDGAPPAALGEVTMIPGIELDADETVQLPTFINTDPTTALVPKRTAFGGTATYRLTGIAQTTTTNMGPQSLVVRHGLTTTALDGGQWLAPATSAVGSRTTATWDPVAGANVHSVVWRDAMNDLLEITVWVEKQSSVDVPTLVALPSSGTLTARIQAIGANLDINDFSLEEDSNLLWGISVQPVNVP